MRAMWRYHGSSMLTSKLPYINRVPKPLLRKWLGFGGWKFWLMLFVEGPLTLVVVPIASLFPRYELRTDTMKRLARQRGEPEYTQYTRIRQYLPKWANWFQTHDNAADELYWGDFDNFINNRFAKYYKTSSLFRYYNCVAWHYRNKAYGYSYYVAGTAKGTDEPAISEYGKEDSGELWVKIEIYQNWYKYEAQIPSTLFKGRYRSINIGWKSHRSAPPLEDGTFNVLYANRLSWIFRRKYK